MATGVLTASASANCNPTMAMDDDMPPNFMSNHTTLCGISYPTTLNNFTHCCKGPVQVDNGCFQYCEAGDTDIFADCVWDSLNDTTFAIACNHHQYADGEIVVRG